AQRFAAEGAHVGFAAEHRRRQRNRHAGVEIAPLALELRIRRRPDPQIQIARLRAAGTLFAFAGDANARPVADAGRDPHVNRARLTLVLDREAARRPAIDVFERKFDLLLDVAALPDVRGARLAGASAPACAGTRPAAAEEGLKEVGERVVAPEHLVHLFLGHRAVAAFAGTAAAEVDVPPATTELARIEPAAAGAGARLLVGAPVRAQLVVLLPLRRITEHLVGLVDLLEAGLGCLVAGIDIRVVLARQLAEGLLDLFLARGLRHAERRVVILEFHQSNPS